MALQRLVQDMTDALLGHSHAVVQFLQSHLAIMVDPEPHEEHVRHALRQFVQNPADDFLDLHRIVIHAAFARG